MHGAYKRRLDRNFTLATTSRTVPGVRIAPLIVLAAAAALGACADDGEQASEGPAPAPPREQPAAPAVPDGGVPEGHGAEDEAPPPRERGSIVVPETDSTPPRPVITLAGSRATLDKGTRRVLVPRDEPFTVTVAGRDPDGGMGRARVAIRARFACRSADGEVVRLRRLVRYVPPPQIARVRIGPGTRTRTELRRTVKQRFDTRCAGGTLERFSGEAWADVTNASGLDATSKHIHFGSR
jgi:hypothetical protein